MAADSTAARMSMYRLFAVTAGSLLVAVVPALVVAGLRQAANEASGHAPNMDPGVVVSLAVVLAVPIVMGVLFIELTRSWGFSQKPLSLTSCVILGAVASWPVGYSFLPMPLQLPGYPALLLASSLGVAAFYAVRWVWLTRSTRGATRA